MINEIFEKLNISKDDIIKKKHGNVPEIKAVELIEAILNCETIPKIAEHFNISVQTINRIFRNLFPETRLTGKRTWKYYLLDLAEYKKCIECEIIKPKTQFYGDNRSLTKTMSICKHCDLLKKNRIKNSISEDSDLYLISKIYDNCPEDYHVDHIMPLNRGGLHHQSNLCYLPSKLNIAKSDKLPEDVPHIMIYAIYPENSS